MIRALTSLLTLCMLMASAAGATEPLMRQALIIGVSQYADPEVAPLPGVVVDLDSARQIARSMGIPDAGITVLKDAQATKSRIVDELRKLASTTADGGRVLVYFSGHGTRWTDSARAECREGLLTHERDTLTHEEIARHTRQLNTLADKVIVMFDACHSEGVNAPRSSLTRSAQARLIAKFSPRTGQQADACSTPVNMSRTRSLMAEATRLGALSENLVQISSSRADEVSFDEPGKGGIATQAIRDCLLGRAQDLDGSGAVSIKEIEACAQGIVNAKIAPFPELKPHHITVLGNRNIVPARLRPAAVLAAPVAAAPAAAPVVAPAAIAPVAAPAATPAATPVAAPVAAPAGVTAAAPAPAPTGPAAADPTIVTAAPSLPLTPALQPPVAPASQALTPTPVPAPPSAVSSAVSSAVTAAVTPVQVAPTIGPDPVVPPAPALLPPVPALASLATLKEIEQQGNPRRELRIRLNRPELRIGRDTLEMTLTSSHDGHVYLVLLGSDRKSFYVLFPNGLDNDNRIRARQPLSLPRSDWALKAAGPPGLNHLLVMVTDTPRDLGALRMAPPTAAAPLTFALTDLPGRTALLGMMIGQGVTGRSESFGARLLSIREIR